MLDNGSPHHARTVAPAHVDTALVVGSGVQAYWQPRALHHERPYRTLLVWARNPDKATALAGELGHVLAGATPARTSADDITIATLAGLGVQDLIAAEVALQNLDAGPI